MDKQINVSCDKCGVNFSKLLKEYNRSEKIGRKHYCSRTCASSTTEKLDLLAKVTPKNVLLKGYDRTDEYSPFRDHLRRAKRRKHECNLTLKDLKEVWDNQNGFCVYSKVKLVSVKKKTEDNPIYTMSLDRIDSAKGYIRGNVQFISIAMNHLKNKMSHIQMLKILKILKYV